MTKLPPKLLLCVDGSLYADNISIHATWAAKRLNADIDVLHILRRHSDYNAPASDHTGTLGLGARSKLMEDLVKVDEERAKLEQQKGRLILEHVAENLKEAGVENINKIHRRGDLGDTIQEFENDAALIFIGKRGEQADPEAALLGSNLEKVARLVSKPLFVVSRYMRPMKKFLIAHDGKDNANKIVDFVCESALLQGMECHILTIQESGLDQTNDAVEKLQNAGYKVVCHAEKSKNVGDVIAGYVADEAIDLLLMGAYSHSRMRTMLLGSTTSKLLKSCRISMILMR